MAQDASDISHLILELLSPITDS